jgi:hypothetical protein
VKAVIQLHFNGAPVSLGADDELAATRNLFAPKDGGIAGGSQEAQWNIIAKRILGLPDPAAKQGERP